MRVLEESYKGVEVGMEIPLKDLGLPAPDKGLLIVFWKGQ